MNCKFRAVTLALLIFYIFFGRLHADNILWCSAHQTVTYGKVYSKLNGSFGFVCGTSEIKTGTKKEKLSHVLIYLFNTRRSHKDMFCAARSRPVEQ